MLPGKWVLLPVTGVIVVRARELAGIWIRMLPELPGAAVAIELGVSGVLLNMGTYNDVWLSWEDTDEKSCGEIASSPSSRSGSSDCGMHVIA